MYYYVLLIPLTLFLLFLWRKREKGIIAAARKHHRRKGGIKMKEFAEQLLDQECIAYTVDGNQVTGTLTGISSDGTSVLMVGPSGEKQIVNLEYVTRLREYPRNKNGKKKSIVAD